MGSVGVRELQQHASAVIRRVATGEEVTVTDRGRVVASIVPVATDPLTALVAAGQARPATRRLSHLGDPLAPTGGRSLTDILFEQRAHER